MGENDLEIVQEGVFGLYKGLRSPVAQIKKKIGQKEMLFATSSVARVPLPVDGAAILVASTFALRYNNIIKN